MRRFVITFLVLSVLTSLQSHAGSDSGTDLLSGTDGDKVVISATETRTIPNGSKSPAHRIDAPQVSDPPQPCTPEPVRSASCGITAVRVTNEQGEPLTITDVAQFAPTPIAAAGEPGNVSVAGLPMNFVAAASTQTRAGTLLSRPISVRFTPVRFDFVYGDGLTATSTSGGRTWSALGQAQFTPTPTSHTYRARGIYPVHARVHYTAEVDIGGGWFPVAGELAIAGPTQQIRVYEANTALVARTCDEQPRAPGC